MSVIYSFNALPPAQKDLWQRLQSRQPHWPHALLFHGPVGAGKVRFAENLAQSLLCQTPQATGWPCDACLSCRWFAQHNHPDCRTVCPEDQADGFSKEIKIDQIRILIENMQVCAYRHGKRVVLLYPAEALNRIAANALLKTLEEPSPHILFLLISHQLNKLVKQFPTLVSRCERWAIPLSSTAIRHEMSALQQEHTWKAGFLHWLGAPEPLGALQWAERLEKNVALVEIVMCVQCWLFDLLCIKLTKNDRAVRYYPHHQDKLVYLASRMMTTDLLAAIKSANVKRAVAEHPLCARLFLETFFLEYLSWTGI